MIARIETWARWFDRIGSDILSLSFNEKVYSSLMEVMSNNPNLPTQTTLYAWLQRAYFLTAATGIRRQCTTRSDSISLLRNLEEIFLYTERITPEIIYEYTLKKNPQIAGYWRDRFAEKHVHVLKDIEADIGRLRDLPTPVVITVTKLIAHIDKAVAEGQHLAPATYEDISQCLTLLQELHNKYSVAVTGKETAFEYIPLGYEWDKVFEIPWKNSEEPVEPR